MSGTAITWALVVAAAFITVLVWSQEANGTKHRPPEDRP